MKCHSHYIISRVPAINMTFTVGVDLGPLAEVVFVRCLRSQVLPLLHAGHAYRTDFRRYFQFCHISTSSKMHFSLEIQRLV